MNKKTAKAKFVSYLKEHRIIYEEHLHNGEVIIMMIFQKCEACPDKVLEASINFFATCMEIRVFYTANASSWIAKSKRVPELYRLLNFINSCVWPCVQDGLGGELYYPRHLHTPRFYLTEDGEFDLTSTTIIDYDYFEVAPLETLDFITAALPDLLNQLSIPIFKFVLGEWEVEQSIFFIKKVILEEK